MEENLALLVIGFDGYSDLWADFFKLYDLNFENKKITLYFVNNEKDIINNNYNCILIHSSESSEWSEKVRIGLSCIKEKYVCLLLEDFYFVNFVKSETVRKVMKFVEANNIRYYQLTNTMPKFKFEKLKTENFNGISKIKKIYMDDDYGINLQPCIWDKKYLMSLIGSENYNAWVFEFDRVRDSRKNKHLYYRDCVYDISNPFCIEQAVIQGNIYPKIDKILCNKGYKISSTRRRMSNYKVFRYKLISYVKSYLNKNQQKKIKLILEKLGMRFVSTIRDK